MATPTTQYRYVSGLGIRTGFTDNQGYNIGITPIVLTQSSGTFSVNPSNLYTFVNLPTALTGTANIVINATSSLIFDHCDIMVQGGSTTYSVILSGNVASATSLTTAIPPNKYSKISGMYNGTAFLFSSYVTV